MPVYLLSSPSNYWWNAIFIMSSGQTICHSPVVLEVPWVVWTIYREFLRIWPIPPPLVYSPLLFPHCLNSYHKELPIASKPGALFLPTFPCAMSSKNAHPCPFPLAVSGSLSLNFFFFITLKGSIALMRAHNEHTYSSGGSHVLSQVPEHVLWWRSGQKS